MLRQADVVGVVTHFIGTYGGHYDIVSSLESPDEASMMSGL